MNLPTYQIKKINISATNLPHTINTLEQAIQKNKLGYVCVTNARTVHLANHDEKYCQIQNNSLLTVPDGTPLVWIANMMGYKEVGRVSGPDLLEKILSISKGKGYSHFFYGSTPQTIDQIKEKISEKFPEILIKGAVSPPFQPIESFDIDSLAQEINDLKPSFFWCGLGAPKQEQFISLLQPKLTNTICIGVGLAFEYFAGTVIKPPIIISKLKLEWLFRCIQQPLKARRFIVPFFWMTGILLKYFFNYRILNKTNNK